MKDLLALILFAAVPGELVVTSSTAGELVVTRQYPPCTAEAKTAVVSGVNQERHPPRRRGISRWRAG